MADSKISALTALTGADVALATDVLAIVDTSAGATKKILADELGIAINLYFAGSSTRDLTAASGAVGYTGVGFKPKAIIFIVCVSDTIAVSLGFSTLTADFAIGQISYTTMSAWTVAGTSSIFVTQAAGSQAASIASFDADGFTLDWVKTGSPTGTANVLYLALR